METNGVGAHTGKRQLPAGTTEVVSTAMVPTGARPAVTAIADPSSCDGNEQYSADGTAVAEDSGEADEAVGSNSDGQGAVQLHALAVSGFQHGVPYTYDNNRKGNRNVQSTSSPSPLASSSPPVAARASLPMNLRRSSRRGEAFHRARFLRCFFSAAASSFLRWTSPLSVASPRRRPGACLAAGDLLLQLLRSLSEQYLSESSSNSRESQASGEPRMEIDTGASQDAGSSSQASGVDLSGVTRGAWKGSEVTQHEIDWLYRSRRIPEGVSCRRPGDEIEPDLKDGEFVIFLAHFERGIGLSASDFFRQFLDFYKLQPHHLPGNAIFYLSCYATFMEAYMGLRPTRETFAHFFSLRINSVQGKEIPKPKPPVQCGSCIIGSRQGSPFFKFAGLDSCRAWERTFFYVKNTGPADLINLPAFNPAVPTRANWSYNPKETHVETNRIIRFMKQLMKDTAFCPDDIVRTFISRRVLPLKRRAHKMSEMYGPGDPTKITGLPLSKEDVVLKARHICQTSMPLDWEWGLLPLSSLNPPTKEAKLRFPRIEAEKRGPCRNRALDKEDPDPYIHWVDLKMGRIPISRPASTDPQVHEHAVPLQAEVGQEFLETSQDKKRNDPEANAGPSAAPQAPQEALQEALREAGDAT
ncbi:hypothetical protein QYE76_030631 [Lolium multiflorum]|uniref:Transposase (putative) gypsy type domain-containing protein n=1 Tax=Lolium multiflorum TaxID=4521 RepID=A0AAD8QTN7_LOLMU|nr:hypothetical protein QYE76_030631 [Lolium multiflorum]